MLRSKRWMMLIALVLLLCMTCVACNSGGAEEPAEPAEEPAPGEEPIVDEGPVVIGSTFTLSGPVAHAGQQAFEGAELAIKYVNEELGGINGREVVLKYYDDEFDEAKIPMLYEKLITQDKVDFLLSPYTSPFLAAAPVVDKNDQIMFCIAADSYVANDAFGQSIVNIQMDEQWRGGMWWHDVVDMFVNFEEWNTKDLEKPKTVAILNLEISYGHEIADAIVPYLEENGFEIVYHEFFEPMQSDWTPVVSKLKELDPDIIFQPHYFEDGVRFVEKCNEMNYSADYMIIEAMSWDPIAWTRPDFGGLDPSIAKAGFFGYAVYKEKYESVSKDYLAAYVADKYNGIPGNDLICGFMSVELAAKAANMAGSVEKADLIDVLTSNTFSLAGYDYTMNETGGNGADFNWGVGQFIPESLENATTDANDWFCVWPEKYADHAPVYPFVAW